MIIFSVSSTLFNNLVASVSALSEVKIYPMNSISPPLNVEWLFSTLSVSPISPYFLLNQLSLSSFYHCSVLISTTTSSAYAIKSWFSNVIASSIGLVAMQNSNIDSGSPCGTPHSTTSIKSACLAFRNTSR